MVHLLLQCRVYEHRDLVFSSWFNAFLACDMVECAELQSGKLPNMLMISEEKYCLWQIASGTILLTRDDRLSAGCVRIIW